MTTPDIDSLTTYAGALNDYSPVIDPTTDRPASAVNQALESVAAMTHTADRAWVRFTLNGTATPVYVNSDSMWGNAPAVQPTFSRTSAGIYTVTFPTTVNDEIQSGQPGFFGPHTLNLRASRTNCRSATTPFFHNSNPTSPNVVTVYVFNAAGSAADPGSATDFDLFVI